MQNPLLMDPFDPVKEFSKRVDFVAVSPKVKAFKNGVMEIIGKGPASNIHAIVGDYGTGKSHINHYLFYKAKENHDILVSYVSCKEVVDATPSKGLFSSLLNQLLLDLQRNAPEDIKPLLEEQYLQHHNDRALKWFKDTFSGSEDWSVEQLEAYERVKKGAELNQGSFFQILESVMKSDVLKSRVRRIVLIVDEFESFAEDHHARDLEQVWKLREVLRKFPYVHWVLSCAARSWKMLSETGQTVDMFGKGSVTTAHFLEPYDKDDRLEIIRTRMLSLVPDYKEEDRQNYSDDDSLTKYCFPFYNKGEGRSLIPGGSLAELIARPDITPRVMMQICSDFYRTFYQGIEEGENERDAFSRARCSLLVRNLFNLIDHDKVEGVRSEVWHSIIKAYRNADKDRFDSLFDQLMAAYVSKQIGPESNRTGFRNQGEHLEFVNEFLRTSLELKSPLKPDSRNYPLLEAIEEHLRLNCLRESFDESLEMDVLAFKIDEFRPKGNLPYRSLMYHKMLDDRAGDSGLLTIEKMKSDFSLFMEQEQDTYTDDAFFRAVKDLVEDGKLILRNEGKYELVDRVPKPRFIEFKREFERVTKKKRMDMTPFFSMLMDASSGFFLPPLVKEVNAWEYSLLVPGKGVRGKLRKVNVPVYFWQEIPDNPAKELPSKPFSLIILNDLDSLELLEKAGMNIEKKGEGIFFSYRGVLGENVCLILAPSDKVIDEDDLNWMDWSRYLNYLQYIIDISEEMNLKVITERPMMSLKNFFQKLFADPSIFPELRWDPRDFYLYSFINFAREKREENISLLSSLLQEDEVVLNPSTIRLAAGLEETFPWLEKQSTRIKKKESVCSYRFLDKSIDQLTHELIQAIGKEPSTLDDIADSYIRSVEKKKQIKDESEGKEKTNIRSPLIVLLSSIANAFPMKFEIIDGKIRNVDQIEGLPSNIENVRWITDMVASNEPKTNKVIAELLGKVNGAREIDVLADLKIASIILKAKDSEGDAYLYGKEKSNVEKDEIKRIRFLQEADNYSNKILLKLNEYYEAIAEFDIPALLQKLTGEANSVSQLIDDERIAEEIRKSIASIEIDAKIQSLKDMANQLEGVRAEIKKTVKKATKGHGIYPPTTYDIQKVEKNLLINIHETRMKLKDLAEGVDDLISSIYQSLEIIYNDKEININHLASFIKGIVSMSNGQDEELEAELNALNTYEYKEKTTRFDNDAFASLSAGLSWERLAKQRLVKIAESTIDRNYDAYEQKISAYEGLTKKFSEDSRAVNHDFDRLREGVGSKKSSAKEKVKKAIRDYETIGFVDSCLNDHLTAGPYFVNQAVRTTRRSLSKEHSQFLESANRAIGENSLLSWLIAEKKKSGDKGFSHLLDFLKEMEQGGIISYRQ